MKKTVKVEELKNRMNQFLATYDSKNCSEDFVLGQRVFLEEILFETENYFGFAYLTQNEVPEGENPGIRHYIVSSIEDMDKRFVDTDKNRVRYY